MANSNPKSGNSKNPKVDPENISMIINEEITEQVNISQISVSEIKNIISEMFVGFNNSNQTLIKYLSSKIETDDDKDSSDETPNPESDKKFNMILSSYIKYDQEPISTGTKFLNNGHKD